MSAEAAPARPEAGLEAVGESLRALLAASRRLRGRETHRPSQLSYAQYGLLFSLAATEVLSARELARHADLTPATVTPMLDSLETAGLITRRRDEQDRRVVLTALTERGARLVADRRAQIEPRWQAALAEFDDDELRIAAATMDRIATFFDELLHEP